MLKAQWRKNSYRHYLSNDVLLTEHEGRSVEYWPKVVTMKTEHSEVRTKRPKAIIPTQGSKKQG